jgi:hypothetical protein
VWQGVLANWSINRWADIIDLDADLYVAEAQIRDVEIRNEARRRQKQKAQPATLDEPAATPKADPCEQISGSKLEHVNGAIAEQKRVEMGAITRSYRATGDPAKVTAAGRISLHITRRTIRFMFGC